MKLKKHPGNSDRFKKKGMKSFQLQVLNYQLSCGGSSFLYIINLLR